MSSEAGIADFRVSECDRKTVPRCGTSNRKCSTAVCFSTTFTRSATWIVIKSRSQNAFVFRTHDRAAQLLRWAPAAPSTCSGVNLTKIPGDSGADPKGFLGARGDVCWRGIPLSVHWERSSTLKRGVIRPLLMAKLNYLTNRVFWYIVGGSFFVRAFARKTGEFSTRSGSLVDVKDLGLLLASSTSAVSAMGLVAAIRCRIFRVGKVWFFHFKRRAVLMNKISEKYALEIIKREKICGGAIFINVPMHTTNSLGVVVSPVPRNWRPRFVYFLFSPEFSRSR